MANIKDIYEDSARTTPFYPRTHVKAVVDNNGDTVENKMAALEDLIHQKQMAIGAVPIDTEPTRGNTDYVVSSDGIAKLLPHQETNTHSLTGSMILIALSTDANFGNAVSHTDAYYKVSDYIPISDAYFIGNCLIVKSSKNSSVYGKVGYVFYDGEKQPISGVVTVSNDTFSTRNIDITSIPSGAAYFRYSTNVDTSVTSASIDIKFDAISGSLIVNKDDLDGGFYNT